MSAYLTKEKHLNYKKDNTELTNLKFPIGEFVIPDKITDEDIKKYINTIETLPSRLTELVSGFSEKQFGTVYREGGWNVRQVINHVADSHMNAYIRFKLALTEKTPVINPYREAVWAEHSDGKSCNPEVSLKLIEALHYRWAMFLKSLSRSDFRRGYFHPELEKVISLEEAAASYSWHGEHHSAHISELKKRKAW